MKPVQCKCRCESDARRTLIKWLANPKLTQVGIEETPAGWMITAMRMVRA